MLKKQKQKDWFDTYYDEIHYYETSGGMYQLFKDRYQTEKQNDDVKFWRIFRCLYEHLEVVYPLVDVQDFLYIDYCPEIMHETMFHEEHEALASIRNKALSGLDFRTIYRGQPDGDINGYSWTLDENLAKWFATRGGRTKNPIIYKAQMPLEEIIVYWNGRKEKEIFAPPKYIHETSNKIEKEKL